MIDYFFFTLRELEATDIDGWMVRFALRESGAAYNIVDWLVCSAISDLRAVFNYNRPWRELGAGDNWLVRSTLRAMGTADIDDEALTACLVFLIWNLFPKQYIIYSFK